MPGVTPKICSDWWNLFSDLEWDVAPENHLANLILYFKGDENIKPKKVKYIGGHRLIEIKTVLKFLGVLVSWFQSS